MHLGTFLVFIFIFSLHEVRFVVNYYNLCNASPHLMHYSYIDIPAMIHSILSACVLCTDITLEQEHYII